MPVTRHGFVLGTAATFASIGIITPARAAALDRFLGHVAAQPDVHVMTLEALARHCLAHPDNWRRA